MDKIRVAMCDDNEYLCDCFEYVITQAHDIDFITKCYNKAQCIKMLESVSIDILLLDIQMDTATTGLELIPIVNQVSPETKIIMLTVHEDNEYIFQAFLMGAQDYFIKSLPMEEILGSIRTVYNNTCILRPAIAQKILEESKKNSTKQSGNVIEGEYKKSLLLMLNVMTKLSNSEFEILKLLYYGKSVNEITQTRFVSESTIRTHIGRILKKFEYSKTKDLIEHLKDLDIFSLFENNE